MKLNLDSQVATLRRMTTAQLADRYAAEFGEPTATRNKLWLLRPIAWRLQARAEGGLSERPKRRAKELADDADLRVLPPRGGISAGNHSPLPKSHYPRIPPTGDLTHTGDVLHYQQRRNAAAATARKKKRPRCAICRCVAVIGFPNHTCGMIRHRTPIAKVDTPYHGRLRQFFPKGTDFTGIHPTEVKQVRDLFNDRPLKRHGNQTPREVLGQNSRLGSFVCECAFQTDVTSSK